MDNIQTGVLIAHTLIALVIIALVLLQRGKGADAGAAFGSGASGTVFGARGSGSFFSRMTAILATVFFVTSLGLAYLSGRSATAPDSLLEGAPALEAEEPAMPEPSESAGELPQLPAGEETDTGTEEALPALPEETESSEPETESPQS